jgi:hypothetical protein
MALPFPVVAPVQYQLRFIGDCPIAPFKVQIFNTEAGGYVTTDVVATDHGPGSSGATHVYSFEYRFIPGLLLINPIHPSRIVQVAANGEFVMSCMSSELTLSYRPTSTGTPP